MSAEAAISVRSWPVGRRIVTLTIPRAEKGRPLFATAQWTPDSPSTLTDEEWREYRFGRQVAITELAEELGITVALLEL